MGGVFSYGHYRMHANNLFRVIALVLLFSISCSGYADDQKPLRPGVVAAQEGAEVTLQDVDAEAANIPESDRPGFFDSPKRIESTILNIIQKKQLAAKARAEHLDRDPIVKAQIELAITTALAKAQADHYRQQIKLPDFDQLAKEYYAAHKGEFLQKGNVVVEHVLIGTKENEHSDKEAKALADKVEAEAKAHPDHFHDLVEKYSNDPSKANNHGRIEKATSPQMAKAFAEAADALHTPGEISPIVKTEFGYHVLKLVERSPDQNLSFDVVRVGIVLRLKKNFIDERMTEYTNEFRGKPLQANPELVASLRTRYAPKGYVSPAEADAKRQQEQKRQQSEQH
jgi:parvulin-like peptidyl-prolyl isomerase